MRRGKLVVRTVLGLLIGIGTATGAVLPASELTMPQILSEANRKPKVQPLYPKLDAGLNRVVEAEDPVTVAKQLGYRTRTERIQVNIVVEPGLVGDVTGWLTENDATHISTANDIVQAHVEAGILEFLGSLEGIVAVRRPTYMSTIAEPEESPSPKILGYTTEGLAPMNANAWHSAGFGGQGLRVGILDYGFYGYQGLLGSELPPNSRVHYRSFTGSQTSSRIGTASAEIIHDIAPDSELYLAEVFTLVDAFNAFDWMQSNGVDIIISSIYPYPESPGDGTGVLANAAHDLYSQGILLVAGGGNFRQNHWQGRWSDSNGNGWMDFTGGDEVNNITDGYNWVWSPPGVEIYGALIWDEWDNPVTDLDLCAVVDYDDGTGLHVLACTEDPQNGGAGQLPREVSEFTTPSYGYYGFAVGRYSGAGNPDMEVFLTRGDAIPEYRNPEGSLYSPADVQEVIGVGAVDALSNSLETYSSKGPTNGPGGSLSGGRTAPDLAAYSLVSTYTYGNRSFWGTGVAAVHVAGAAALVWSAHPSWTNAQVRSYLESNAIDMGPGGKDNDYGHGRLYLGDPPQSCTYSISPTSQHFGASGGSGTINVSTQSGCSWTASESLSWVSITSGSSGNGSGTVRFNVSSNSSSSSRSGTIQAAGKTFAISQDGAASCSYSISPTSKSFTSSGGTGTVSVSTASGCSWTASSNAGWITVTSGSSGNGSGTVGYRVASNGSTSQRSGSMTIAGRNFSVTQSGAQSGGGDEIYLVAGMAHANGAGGSVWRSTLAVTNRSGSAASLTLVYRYGGSSVTRSHTLQNGAIVEWVDVATSLFGVGGTSAGSIQVQSTRPVIVTARTYNEGASGTFGQALPGADDGNNLAYGERGILPQVKKNAAFRTNIGFVNLGSSSVTIRTKLYSSSGGQMGTTVTTSIPANQWKQDNDVFQKAGVSYCEVGYATIEVTTYGGKIWAYASVVDNGTGDPTTIPVSVE